MAPDDPARLPLLLAALAFAFGSACGGAAVWAWLAPVRRRALDLEIRLRACVARENAELETRRRLGQTARALAGTLDDLRRR